MCHKSRLTPFQGCIKLIPFPPGFTRCCYITPLSGLNTKQANTTTSRAASCPKPRDRLSSKKGGEF